MLKNCTRGQLLGLELGGEHHPKLTRCTSSRGSSPPSAAVPPGTASAGAGERSLGEGSPGAGRAAEGPEGSSPGEVDNQGCEGKKKRSVTRCHGCTSVQ
jgi:hypothetical protein